MRRTRIIIGALLIIIAVGGMIYWETAGRDKAVTAEVVAAACDIGEGDVITKEMLCTAKVLRENKISGACTEKGIPKLSGKIADCFIPKNAQISTAMLKKEESLLQKGKSPCRLSAEQILSMSSSIRQGDEVRIFRGSDMAELGTYTVAFAKDESNREITDAGRRQVRKNLLERTDSERVLDHIEIQASPQEYSMLLGEAGAEGLIVIQKGE
ncbi:MAG: hypothetical protein K6F52_01525 [Clostridia bacterium]|nr:hypothetical protein [Clostridia bacterium]